MASASLGCGGQAASNGSNDEANGGAGGSSLTGTSGGSGGTGGTGAGGLSTEVAGVMGGPVTAATTTTGGGGIGGAGGAPPEPGAERATCEQSSDCVVDQGCCGLCVVDDPANLVAVNQKYQSALMPECQEVMCGQCGTPDALVTFGAFCNAGTCEVFDLQESPLSECTVKEDCRLRAGLNCCEGCGDAQWVAVSADFEAVQAELCGDNAVACDLCEPGQPSMLVPDCDQYGRCFVDRLLF